MDFKQDIGFRKKKLADLLVAIQKHEKDIIAALRQDLGKPEFEAVVTETAFVISDLEHTLRNIYTWSKPERVRPSILNFPSRDYIIREPYGKVLIMAPWNYPFQLALAPLIAAVAAGNSVVLKPSEHTPNVASIIEIIIAETFDPVHVEVFQGGAEVARLLLDRKWDYIFFTGSVAVGKIVAKAAAENLTPVTLELGGKSPCIVDQSANLSLAARRIVWGKFLNAGQTCIAPDYLLVHETIKHRMVETLKTEINRLYGENILDSPDYARLVNDHHYNRVRNMLADQKVLCGGVFDDAQKYIAPTLIDNPSPDSACMTEEIFGPVLPVLTYRDESEMDAVLNRYPRPLAFYVFTADIQRADELLRKHSFGGGCVNDVIVHVANRRLPFGGVGDSGMGAYHGKFGFDTFSHRKSVVYRGTWIDPPLRYAPYKDILRLIKPLLRWFN